MSMGKGPRPWGVRHQMLEYAKKHLFPAASMADVYAGLAAKFPNVEKKNMYAMKGYLSDANEEVRRARAAAVTVANGQPAEPLEQGQEQEPQPTSPLSLSLTIPADLDPEARALIGELLNARMAMIQELQAKELEIINSRNALVAVSAKLRLVKKVSHDLMEAI